MQRRKTSVRTVHRLSANQNISQSDISARKLSFRDKIPGSTEKFVNNISLELSSKKPQSSLVQTLQQLEKKSTQDFYNKNYEQAFETLKCCEQINGRLGSIEHRVYIHYLYTQFYFKLKQYPNSLHHYDIAKEIYSASSYCQQKRLHHYITNIQFIHASLLFEMKQYNEVIKCVSGLIEDFQKGSQQWYKCETIRFKAYFNLQKFQQSIKITQQLLRCSKTDAEKYKYTLKTIECLIKLKKPQKAVQLLEIYLKQQSIQKQSEIISKLSEICLQMGDTIRSIYYYEKLAQYASYQADSFKILSRLYFDIGDWNQLQSSLISLSNFSDLTYQDLHLLAQARQFLGNPESSIQIYCEIVQKSTQRMQKLKAYLQLSKLSQQPTSYQGQIIKQSSYFKSEQSYRIMKQYISILSWSCEHQKAEHLYELVLNQTALQKYSTLHYEFLRDFGQMLERLERKNQSQVCYNRANKIHRASIRYE